MREWHASDKRCTKYKAIIIPAVKKMPADVLAHLISLVEQGAKILFLCGELSLVMLPDFLVG